MPNSPLEFRIVKNLQAALAAIAVEDSYHFTVAGTAVKLNPNHKVEELISPNGPRPFVVIEVRPEEWSYEGRPNRLRISWPLTIHAVAESDPLDDDSRLETFFKLSADVERAISRDITRGGLAHETKILTRRIEFDIESSQVWAEIDVRILMHRVYGEANG